MNIFDRLRQKVTTDSATDTRQVAAELARALPDDTTLALHGDLGAGKTTFVQGLAQGLGISERITSPTFAIYSVYRSARLRLVHLDAYRLENAAQLDALLLDEFLISPYCFAVEWPERAADWLPKNALHLTLAIEQGDRHTIRLH